MPTIAVIDDRKDPRMSRSRLLEPHVLKISKDWEVLPAAPLSRLEDYPSWISENEVAVIVVDQKLDDEPPPGQRRSVGYTGTVLARYLRRHALDFPIYMVSSYAGPTSKADNAVFEEVFDKRTFDAQAEVLSWRMLRAGTQYSAMHHAQLNELSDIAARIVDDKASAKDLRRAKAIRTQLSIAFDPDEFLLRARWIKGLEDAMGDLEMTAAHLKKVLHKKK